MSRHFAMQFDTMGVNEGKKGHSHHFSVWRFSLRRFRLSCKCLTNFWIIALGTADRTVEVLLLCFVQVSLDNPFKALLGSKSLGCSEPGQALTNQCPSSNPKGPASCRLAPTDPIQARTNPVEVSMQHNHMRPLHGPGIFPAIPVVGFWTWRPPRI